jgi:class 3 adenylate cyclase
MQPVTRYVSVDGARVAYQTFGDGPVDLVLSAGSFSHTDVVWEDAGAALFLTRLGASARVIRYDRLGTSGSDPLPEGWDPGPTGFARELEAVLDAVGASEIVLVAMLDAGPVAIDYAANHPDRVRKLVLYNTTARFLAADDYDAGISAAAMSDLLAHIDTLWGTEAQVALNVPSREGDARFAAWYSKYLRSIGTPTTIVGLLQQDLAMDARSVLATLPMPVLVMHRTDYSVIPVSHGRFLADEIPGAHYVEIPGRDGPMMWDRPDLILDELRAFVASGAGPHDPTVQFATILFTDIIQSTELAESLGDRDWGSVIGAVQEIARGILADHGGRLVKWTGDGILAAFADPGEALDAARELRAKTAEMAIPLRLGLHTGRVEVTADDVAGIAVHIAARVMATAGAGEIVVSRTVRDLLLGSGYRFHDLGPHELRGVTDDWQLYALESGPI